MRVKHLILLFVFILHGGIKLYAQVSKTTRLFYHISEKDGLADNIINCFFQDSRGTMWMGTENGLSSFDGSEIRTWQASDKPNIYGLLNNQVNSITEDKNQTLWIATSNGLSALNIVTKQMRSWLFKGSNYLRGITCDGNNVWIATSGSLALFDSRKQVFKRFYNSIDKKQGNNVYYNNDCNTLLFDSKKRLWIGTVNGVWLFDTKNHTYTQYDGPQNDDKFDGMINTVFEDHAGKIWVGCWSKGLKEIIPESRTVKNYNSVPDLPAHIMSIVEQKGINNKYRLWLSDYLTEYNIDEGLVEHHDLRPIAEAASLEPRCLYVSKDNLLWISTVKGVYILDPSRQLFKHTFISKQGNITNQNPALYSQKEKLWMGGDQDFLLKIFDNDFNVIKDYSPAIKALGANFAVQGVAVMNITQYRNNELLLSTSDGILKLNTLTDKLSIICNGITDSLKRTSGFINNTIVVNNEIWCFPWRRGIWKYDEQSKIFKPLVVKLPDASGTPKNLNLQDAVSDKFGNVWITDLDYGLIKYSITKRKAERVVNKFVSPFSRVINIRNINGKLWLVDNVTVVLIDPESSKVQGWPLPNGRNKYVYDYTNDKNGNIWIATRTGLLVFNTVNHSFNQYTEEDGLINNDMNGAIKELPSGKVVYAAENYLTTFTPDELLRTPEKKKLMLTEVNAGDTDLLRNNQKIIIPPGTEKVKFKWALANYTNPLLNRYYSKLDKIDKDWNYVGNKGQVEYIGLPPGKYTFRYRAVTSDGLARSEKTLMFNVAPTVWQTWWFRTLLVLAFTGCIYLVINEVKVREQRKSALQLQLSALEMKALRAQMNPHFIFNALNSIQECIITKNTNTAYIYLSSFSKLVRMILENSEKQFITLEDEIETLKLYLSVEKLRFDDTFEYQISAGESLDPSFIHIPAMVIQPFVENALWHGLIHKKGEKKLTINFDQDENKLVCTVTDNGVGRDISTEMNTNSQIKKQSMGVKITQERLQLLETDASININDLKDAAGIANGTKVTVIIPLGN